MNQKARLNAAADATLENLSVIACNINEESDNVFAWLFRGTNN